MSVKRKRTEESDFLKNEKEEKKKNGDLKTCRQTLREKVNRKG